MSSNFILERLEISGDKFISQREIDFKEGLNIITGNNGTGKTTILNIINLLTNLNTREDFLSRFNNLRFKYFLHSKNLGFNKNTKIIFETIKGKTNLSSESIELREYEIHNIYNKIKILFIQEMGILDLTSKEELPEYINFDKKFMHIFIEQTEDLENHIILVDGVYGFDLYRAYLFFKYIADLSEKNQVIVALLPNFLLQLRNYLVGLDSKLLSYLRQSQIIYLRSFYQHSIIDYFKEEPISSFLQEFRESIKNIKKIMSLPVVEQEMKIILNRMMYVNVITVMETYLSDSFIKLVIGNKYFKLKLLEVSPDFNDIKLNLREAYEWLEDIDANIIEKLQNIVFHNLERIIGMFRNVLGITFLDDMGDIFKAILKRHDIIHRNGKTKEGKVIKISKQNVLELINSVVRLIEHIERQISNI